MRPDLFCAARRCSIRRRHEHDARSEHSTDRDRIRGVGNPNDPVYYEYMKSYSPYDNVTAQAYPDLLVTAGLNDPRVTTGNPPNGRHGSATIRRATACSS